MSALDAPTRGLVAVAASLNEATEAGCAALMRAARAAGAEAAWLEELVLEAPLFVGFPRALVAAAALRQVEPAIGAVGDAADYSRWRDWLARGEGAARRIYGASYERLRRNLAALHPALDAWVVLDGYGRALSRPGLDPRRRELCAIAMLVAQGVPRQLHSHLRGALNTGATTGEVEGVLEIAAGSAPADRVAEARRVWDGVRRDVH